MEAQGGPSWNAKCRPITEDGEEEEDSTHAVEIHVGLLGYLAFRDPVRSSAAGAVAECQHAGVRVIMVRPPPLDSMSARVMRADVFSIV